MSIIIKVAFCKKCNGYGCATPAEKKNIHHPEIIDHYFYHGEPYFTLDHNTFENHIQYESMEIKLISFPEHVKADNLYCSCLKKAVIFQEFELIEKYETDIYFKDLYKFYHIKTTNVTSLYTGQRYFWPVYNEAW